jgi:hypothetical protein
VLEERAAAIDELPPRGRVVLRQQTGNRHGCERRIAEKRIAIVVGELDRFVHGVQVVR